MWVGSTGNNSSRTDLSAITDVRSGQRVLRERRDQAISYLVSCSAAPEPLARSGTPSNDNDAWGTMPEPATRTTPAPGTELVSAIRFGL